MAIPFALIASLASSAMSSGGKEQQANPLIGQMWGEDETEPRRKKAGLYEAMMAQRMQALRDAGMQNYEGFNG